MLPVFMRHKRDKSLCPLLFHAIVSLCYHKFTNLKYMEGKLVILVVSYSDSACRIF